MSSFTHGLTRSFRAAGRGLLVAFAAERTFRIMVGVALVLIAVLATLPLQAWERVLLALLIGGVLVLELLNSMVERLVDLLKPRMNAYVGEVKDLMAATVLLASVFSALVAAFILFPHVVTLLSQF